MSDWFFRPLYYLESLDEPVREILIVAMLRFAQHMLPTDIIRVTSTDLLMVLLQAS